MRLLLVCSILGLVGAAGCTRTAEEHDAAPQRDMGTPSVDVGHDAPATACTTAAQCDDHVACTIDDCVIGNVCSHTAVNGSCNVAAGEHCDLTLGCTTMTSTTCTQASDCDDHVFCNGAEICVLNHCYADPAGRDCNDGNDCTTDTCDESISHCAYTTICDSGVHAMDTGPVCTTFTPATDFNGTFFVAPAQNQGCGVTMYSLSRIVLSVTGTSASATGLTIMGSGVTMTGTVTGNTFDVSYAGCGAYHLTGTFGSFRESFDGHWSAMYGGGAGCGSCTTMSVDVTGLRSGS
jgi:hypothetical protein